MQFINAFAVFEKHAFPVLEI